LYHPGFAHFTRERRKGVREKGRGVKEKGAGVRVF
jgi:hypothetical protein